MKEQYTTPEAEIITFAAEDVIVTSITPNGNYDEFGGKGDIQIGG